MNPPWAEFPDIPMGSAGWRMGHGEPYMQRWVAWYRALHPDERHTYRKSWPEPRSWTGFVSYIDDGILPPSAAERLARLEGVIVLFRQIDTLTRDFPLEINSLRRMAFARRRAFVSAVPLSIFRRKYTFLYRKDDHPPADRPARQAQRDGDRARELGPVAEGNCRRGTHAAAAHACRALRRRARRARSAGAGLSAYG